MFKVFLRILFLDAEIIAFSASHGQGRKQILIGWEK